MHSIAAHKLSMARLNIEVIRAWRDRQEVVQVSLEEGATALDALRASGLQQHHPEIDADEPALGIFGQRVPPGTPLVQGDRVEVYRPLLVDPRESRRAKVLAKRKLKR